MPRLLRLLLLLLLLLFFNAMMLLAPNVCYKRYGDEDEDANNDINDDAGLDQRRTTAAEINQKCHFSETVCTARLAHHVYLTMD